MHRDRDLGKRIDAGEKRWISAGIGYTLVFALVAGAANYALPYDPQPHANLPFVGFFLWSLQYIPLLVFPILAKWKVKGFGFTINPPTVITSLVLAAVIGGLLAGKTTTWTGAFTEAFARTGEELFFRGFLFLLLLKIFESKPKPWLWAAVISAVIFTLVHTQTFQSSYFDHRGAGPIAYRIVDRLFNVFLLGFAFAALRHWTSSILPGAILHSLLQAGPVTLPFVFLIYAVILLWAAARKEGVVSGFSVASVT